MKTYNGDAVAVVAQAEGRIDTPWGQPLVVKVDMPLKGVPRDPRQVSDKLKSVAAQIIELMIRDALTAVRQRLTALADPEPGSDPWQAMQPAKMVPERAAMLAEKSGVPLDQIMAQEMWMNDLYTVTVRRMPYSDLADGGLNVGMIHLSIRRFDRAAVRDWRHFQRIKNDIVGPEHEGVELYPAESRLNDEANQYHMYVIDKAGHHFPIGSGERTVGEASLGGLSQQRPFHPADRPADCDAHA